MQSTPAQTPATTPAPIDVKMPRRWHNDLLQLVGRGWTVVQRRAETSLLAIPLHHHLLQDSLHPPRPRPPSPTTCLPGSNGTRQSPRRSDATATRSTQPLNACLWLPLTPETTPL